jgi:hypothetical protein
MFRTLAKTLLHASGASEARHRPSLPKSWYREDLPEQTRPKRWEDWR